MSDRESLSESERTLVDTNLFVAIGDPPHPKFQQLREVVRTKNVVLSVPERVREELAVHPNERRLSTALDEGWAEIISPPPLTAGEAIAATDRARQKIAQLTNQDEHEVEKADTIFAGLAVEYLSRGDDRITVLTDDGPATTAIKTAVRTSDVHGTVRVLTLEEILGDTGDDTGITIYSDGATSGTILTYCTTREDVGDTVHDQSEYIDQSELTLEYVSKNWL